jgi:hypothetical protein
MYYAGARERSLLYSWDRASLHMNSLNVTNEMQLLKTLLLSLLYTFRALLALHQELTETVSAAYSDSIQ